MNGWDVAWLLPGRSCATTDTCSAGLSSVVSTKQPAITAPVTAADDIAGELIFYEVVIPTYAEFHDTEETFIPNAACGQDMPTRTDKKASVTLVRACDLESTTILGTASARDPNSISSVSAAQTVVPASVDFTSDMITSGTEPATNNIPSATSTSAVPVSTTPGNLTFVNHPSTPSVSTLTPTGLMVAESGATPSESEHDASPQGWN
ncbi:hypothetical protein OBBRIDRAFT_803412 [Obba rivulosa]|uniref:Uncharacterized protein n=1 Tax=Obba rivulosa TaxID=1052685 RepID=A0A8E2AVE3_9APHY|nr:hypothetical protein OBBRIDRAFT_803412 [Obba rivulosa]